ncbi:MAG: formyltetrahydrofolate deformylase [Alphaproteobacteria bacterium]|nr:formyltetrahydrofolate deformylase [Alphaproteobacteria bacterium]MBU6473523.1 formyltetrahydrofolate deformylase [Alphaproteobacteria bacterium]MDE2011631.1 formyltetrahydrofolate deformylase [Alphaproteobacteria bacterium]MDE2073936.1 formyltetrahydrofolate deformylase [Alphaproteobacteria bacterium]MDE2351855.1 formyltetrahydrofolate deformylase [Alphaproteobacteria bacterium]
MSDSPADQALDIVLTVSCPDRMGVVASVSRFLVDHGCNVTSSSQFGDSGNGRFFLRISFLSEQGHGVAELEKDFRPIAGQFAMNAEFHAAAGKTRTLIMVSKFGHCLVDLLYRVRIGALPIEVPVIVSNHRDFADVAAAHGVPFRYLPVTRDNKAEQEQALREIVAEKKIDLVVLARYMQVLSPELCGELQGRAINIHHSFLPSFKGAKPFHQAYARGVKLIGATAHYVTAVLDDGQIIEQEVERVSHAMSPAEYAAVGRDIENRVLARAVKWHAEHRILLNDRRTVVFA